MHVQVVTYRIREVSDAQFIAANQDFASMMASVPGLLAKIWLKAPEGNVYGGVYLWEDRKAYEEFIAGELWASVLADDSLADLESQDFTAMEELSRATQPRLQVFRPTR
ncbi:MAG: YdhR family protein [Chloroflexota bacterium]|nr:YdhR family protein [Chloroflexota bacterium]